MAWNLWQHIVCITNCARDISPTDCQQSTFCGVFEQLVAHVFLFMLLLIVKMTSWLTVLHCDKQRILILECARYFGTHEQCVVAPGSLFSISKHAEAMYFLQNCFAVYVFFFLKIIRRSQSFVCRIVQYNIYAALVHNMDHRCWVWGWESVAQSVSRAIRDHKAPRVWASYVLPIVFFVWKTSSNTVVRADVGTPRNERGVALNLSSGRSLFWPQ